MICKSRWTLIGAIAAAASMTALACGDDNGDDGDTNGGEEDAGSGNDNNDGTSDGNNNNNGNSNNTGDMMDGGEPPVMIEECPDHPNVTPSGELCELNGTLNEDLEISAGKIWVLNGGVFVGKDRGALPDADAVTLTINPGSTIVGADGLSFLTVNRGNKIMAEGTAADPIVFTSANDPGDRAPQDWGGLIINGFAPVNNCAGGDVCEAVGEGGTGTYGGDDPADNSGVLKYVRVEYAGNAISPDNELNGIAFQGVGSGTEIDYIQVHFNKDDGIEFFGGTAQAKHVVTTGIGDDNIDWTDGWVGSLQFAVAQQYDGIGHQGIEADNNAEDNTTTPFSNPTLSNITLIGSPDSSASDVGILVREGTKGALHNMLVLGFNDSCLHVDHEQTWTNAGDGSLAIMNSIISCASNYTETNCTLDANDECIPATIVTTTEDWFTGEATNEVVAEADMDTLLEDPFNQEEPDFLPAAGSPALGAGEAPSGNFFDEVDYVGAMGDEDWTEGWTTHDPN